jgi:hypothetical protein
LQRGHDLSVPFQQGRLVAVVQQRQLLQQRGQGRDGYAPGSRLALQEILSLQQAKSGGQRALRWTATTKGQPSQRQGNT